LIQADAKPADFLRIAHRGASFECPENTLSAFRRAIELGAGMIECDLQVTADGHVVVIHDWTVDRTTDGSGLIRDMTLAELKQLDAGSWHDARFAGERLPTLEEVLDAVLVHGDLNLELKSRGGTDEARRLALTTVAAVSQRQALGRVIFSSFDPTLLAAVREIAPDAAIGVLWMGAPFDLAFALADQLGAVALHPQVTAVDVALVQEASRRSLRVHAWTVNSVEDMVTLARLGVQGIISDYPGRLLEARARLLVA
jgi:glycerophosphoryl diester phosphodiesterase